MRKHEARTALDPLMMTYRSFTLKLSATTSEFHAHNELMIFLMEAISVDWKSPLSLFNLIDGIEETLKFVLVEYFSRTNC